MIPLYKLEKIPRTQKLGKIAKIFTMAEKRLCMASENKGLSIFYPCRTCLFFFFFEIAFQRHAFSGGNSNRVYLIFPCF
jgi:hypothetical protein